MPDDLALLLDRRAVSRTVMMGMRTIDRLVATKKFPEPAIVLSSKLKRWTREQVTEWIEKTIGNDAKKAVK